MTPYLSAHVVSLGVKYVISSMYADLPTVQVPSGAEYWIGSSDTWSKLVLCMQGFLAPGTDVTPIAPALQEIWQDSMGRSLADFNFRTVTSKFNDLVYQYPIRIPERYSLVIRYVGKPCMIVKLHRATL